MNEKSPMVSIIIPVYNGANYVKDAIECALNQTYANVEIIVVNDGSNDNFETEKIALAYGSKIKYYHKTNGGVSSALNYGISKMSGEYFSWLSHDDLYDKNKIYNQMQAIINENADISYCGSQLIDEYGKKIIGKKTKLSGVYSSFDLFKLHCYGFSLLGCNFLISKKVIDKAGFFDENMRYCQDIDYWYRMLFEEYKVVIIQDVLVSYRVHGRQVTNFIPERGVIESKIVSDKFINAVYNDSSKINYLILYLYYNALNYNISRCKEIKTVLKKNKVYKFNMIFKTFFYKVKGFGIMSLKKVYRFLLYRKRNKK